MAYKLPQVEHKRFRPHLTTNPDEIYYDCSVNRRIDITNKRIINFLANVKSKWKERQRANMSEKRKRNEEKQKKNFSQESLPVIKMNNETTNMESCINWSSMSATHLQQIYDLWIGNLRAKKQKKKRK